MENIKKTIKRLIDELDNIKKVQNEILDTTVEDEINRLVGSSTKDNKPLDVSDAFKMKISSKGNNNLYLLQKQLTNSYSTIYRTVVELNSFLTKPMKKVLEMEDILKKEIINVKEFELLFSYGKESQKSFRTRLHNPLPYIQNSIGSKILYNKNEVEKWLKQKNKVY